MTELDTILLSASVSVLVSVAITWTAPLWVEPLLDWLEPGSSMAGAKRTSES